MLHSTVLFLTLPGVNLASGRELLSKKVCEVGRCFSLMTLSETHVNYSLYSVGLSALALFLSHLLLKRHYQQAIDFYQQSLVIKRGIGDRNGEATAWFNLGEVLENVNGESDAIGAYRNACKLYQAIGLDTNAQDCDREIERLSQPQVPTIPRRGFWQWLSSLWCWLKTVGQ